MCSLGETRSGDKKEMTLGACPCSNGILYRRGVSPPCLIVAAMPQILADTSLFLHLLHGGPGLILPFLLLLVACVTAIASIINRKSVAWSLFFACMPFIWAAVVSHNDMTGALSVLSGSGMTDPKQTAERFAFGRTIYQLGVLLSLTFGGVAIFQHFAYGSKPAASTPQA